MERALNAPALLARLRMRQIVLLLAIEERGTLRAAAAALNMTQSAASKMLHELEQAIGQPLFERVGRGLALTAAGDCVMGYFRGMRGTVSRWRASWKSCGSAARASCSSAASWPPRPGR